MTRGERLPIIIPRLVDPEAVSADERDEQLMLLEAARTSLDVEWTYTLAVSDAEADHDLFGYPSTIAYLKDRCRMAGGRARRYVSMARTAHRFRATLLSWKHRQISSDQAELLFRAAERMPDKYPDAEHVLIEIAGDTSDETRKILDYWRHSVDRPGLQADLEAQLQRRRLDVTRKTNGMVAGSFEMPSLAGETLLTALDALMQPTDTTDDRTPSQRRCDALEDMARSFLEGTETPQVGGEKPHLNLHVDLAALRDEPGVLHETETGHVLDPETIRQLACDSSVSRIVWGPESEIIDVGRKTRVIPAALRKAVIVRDRHCTWPGCDRDPRWCDIHNITHWADGGETNLDNLRLLCRYHHTMIHQEDDQRVDARRN